MIRSFSSFALILAFVLGSAVPSEAAVTFVIDSIEVFSDGVSPTTGTVDVYLDVTAPDITQQVGSWKASVNAMNFTGSIGSVTLGSVGEPLSHADLYPGSSVDDNSLPGSATGSSAISDNSNPLLFDGAGLMSFSFTVPTGQLGTFDLVFSTTAPFNTDIQRPVTGGGASFGPDFSDATITVSPTAVPEPTSVAVFGLLGVAGIVRHRLGRRHTGKTTS